MSNEALFTIEDLRGRVSTSVVDRLLDDDGVGVVDQNAITRLIADASSTVWAYLPDDYELKTDGAIPPNKVVPPYIKKLALDVGQGTLYNRHPEYARADGGDLLKQAMKDLESYKRQLTQVKEITRDDQSGAVASDVIADRGWTRTR